MSSSDGGLILRTLVDANVQFVVVGEPGAAGALGLVVSRHPTNLEALGRALDALGSSLRRAPEEGPSGLHRIGDPAGTVAVRTAGGDVDLLFGGVHRSLYADTFEQSEEREVDGVDVRWCREPAPVEPPGRATPRMLGQRLLTVADELAQLMERRDDRTEPGGSTPTAAEPGPSTPITAEPGPDGDRPPAGSNRATGGTERKAEPGTAG